MTPVAKLAGVRFKEGNNRSKRVYRVGLSRRNTLVQVNGVELLELLKSEDGIGINGNENEQLLPTNLCTMIDRVNEELRLQKADSPFFDQYCEQNPSPSFMSSEVAVDFEAGKLGQGEFCRSVRQYLTTILSFLVHINSSSLLHILRHLQHL